MSNETNLSPTEVSASTRESTNPSRQSQSHSQSGGRPAQCQSQSQVIAAQAATPHSGLFANYQNGAFYDEMFDASGNPRPEYRAVYDQISAMTPAEFEARRKRADLTLLQQGITFIVYGEGEGGNTERIFPFDLMPRIIAAREWDRIERGLQQRIRALNLFIADIYGDQKILRDGVVPMDLVLECPDYRREVQGIRAPKGVHIHITGTDLVRDDSGEFYVLEDNLRSPSGACYVLQNRQVMKDVFPNTFSRYGVRSVDSYCLDLRDSLRAVAPEGVENPTIVLLTPGIYNAAYYDHAFIAQADGR